MSCMRIDSATAVLCVIDVQERLVAAVPSGPHVVERCERLAAAAALLGVPALLTVLEPMGRGATPAPLAARLPPAISRASFSGWGSERFREALPAAAATAVLAGLETHVAIAQTALDLLAEGLGVFIAVDAVAAAVPLDHEIALRRLEAAGAVLTTTAAVLGEWCRAVDHPRFAAVQQLVH